MSHLYIILIVVFFGCNSCNRNVANHSIKSSDMAANIIELKVNEDTTIRLPNRGSSGLRIIFTVSDSSVASVTRKDLKSSDVDQPDIKPGDTVPAIFIIKGLKAGSTTIHFAERKPGVDAGSDIPLKDFEVHVKE